MTKAAFEGKETRENLRQMAIERAEGERERDDDGKSDGEEFDERERSLNDSSARIVLREADLEKIDEKGRRHA